MKRVLLIGIVMLATAQLCRAKDVALILNDREQQLMIGAIDATVRAQGITSAQNMLHLLNKLQTAPVVTDTKTDAPSKVPEVKREPTK